MLGEAATQAFVPCHAPDGRLVAEVGIYVSHTAVGKASLPPSLVVLSPEQAREYGEEHIQLRERGRYEYRLVSRLGDGRPLALRAGRAILPSRLEYPDGERGLIEPGDFCGRLPLAVIAKSDPAEQPLATGAVEVRSLKLNYREHYRGMLSYIAERSAALLLDCRSSTRLRLESLWQTDVRFLEQQLEFLRHTLESPSFQGAVREVLRNPHRRLEEDTRERSIFQIQRSDRHLARQLVSASRRITVPDGHPLACRVASLPAKVHARRRSDCLDTPENRFIKMTLTTWRGFLDEISAHLQSRGGDKDLPEDERLLREVSRLRGMLEGLLARGFLPDVSPPAGLPLGSPVLQRKSGYRELFHYWIQFHANAQLSWDGGQDVFHAGARNVATLYEYWLFFHLEALFRQKFLCEQPLHAMLVDTAAVPPRLALRRGVELRTPVSGVWSAVAGRKLRAEFHFNRQFTPSTDHLRPGSWTRGMRPDYTISVWPAAYERDQAEALELMAHVHFDAKYRVERLYELLDTDEDADDNQADWGVSHDAAKDADLLKMHAYRDAIRRTAGAYVLYPGVSGAGRMYQGFHEVLPGLGAFAVCPDGQGNASGLDCVSRFLDEVIAHLADRSTARERVSYHVAEAYHAREPRLSYGAPALWETDPTAPAYRALPPAEEMVLVAWYNTEAQLALARGETGCVYVRLGRRAGALHVHPLLAQTRHVLLRTADSVVAPGLFTLREPGFRVYTRGQLRRVLEEVGGASAVETWRDTAGEDEEEYLYGLFKTCLSEAFPGQRWDGVALMRAIEGFESDHRRRPVVNLGRSSPYPRLLPLSVLLRIRA